MYIQYKIMSLIFWGSRVNIISLEKTGVWCYFIVCMTYGKKSRWSRSQLLSRVLMGGGGSDFPSSKPFPKLLP